MLTLFDFCNIEIPVKDKENTIWLNTIVPFNLTSSRKAELRATTTGCNVSDLMALWCEYKLHLTTHTDDIQLYDYITYLHKLMRILCAGKETLRLRAASRTSERALKECTFLLIARGASAPQLLSITSAPPRPISLVCGNTQRGHSLMHINRGCPPPQHIYYNHARIEREARGFILMPCTFGPTKWIAPFRIQLTQVWAYSQLLRVRVNVNVKRGIRQTDRV